MDNEPILIAAAATIAVIGTIMAIRGYRRDRPPPPEPPPAEYPDDYNPQVFRD